MIKKIVRGFFRRRGFEIVKSVDISSPKSRSDEDTMSSTLKRIYALGISPGCIIDVGAASGNWSKEVHELWPNSTIVAIEPLEEQIERLHKNTSSFKDKVKIIQAVAGDQKGEIDFNVTDDPDGSGVYGKGKGTVIKLPVVKIDDVCENTSAPYILKLDTHGYEFPILMGASEIVKKSEVVIIEVYGFYVSPTAPLFHQVSVFMEKNGFRLYDIVDVMRRKKDQAFWQADAVYLKANHKVFSDNNYQ